MMQSDFILSIFIFSIFTIGHNNGEQYYGTRIGKFSTHFHDVKGDVYAVDDKTIFIKNFYYDGKGTDTFFWAGTSIRPDPSGFVVPNERGLITNLGTYSGRNIILRLPDKKTVKDIRWLAVWSKRFRANFGSLIFPKTLHPPQAVVIGSLTNTKHGISSGDIMILDTQTLLVPNFNYDGTGSSACWWLSRGMKPNTGGIQLLDEEYGDTSLKMVQNETVVLWLPEGHSIFDYNTLSVWSKIDIDDYGVVKIVTDIKVPPSTRSLGISQENKLNCETLNDDLGFEARWLINEDQLLMQLHGKLGTNEYMALGFSKDDTETKFTLADAVLTWMSDDNHGHAVDYFLQNTDKCEDGHGMCPDTVHVGAKNNIVLLNAVKNNDSVTVIFRRSLKAVDEQYDQNIYTDGPQAVLWAIGSISEDGEPGPPKLRTRGNLLLDFGREPNWNCLSPESMKLITEIDTPVKAHVERIHCPMDHTFRAQLGPRIQEDDPERVWYINGLPTPVLTVQRGQIYTFVVEGGNTPPSHHPLYITSSAEGGLYQKILEANEDGEAVFAGVTHDPITQALLPTAEGRLCEWSISTKNPEYTIITSNMKTQLALSLNCDSGNAGVLIWRPDGNTSEIIYYQSFTEKNLGGQIRVVDFCEETNSEYYLEELQKQHDTTVEKPSTQIEETNLEREDISGNIPNSKIAPTSNMKEYDDIEYTLPKSEQKIFHNPITTHELAAGNEDGKLEPEINLEGDHEINKESMINDVQKFLDEINRPVEIGVQGLPVVSEKEPDKSPVIERTDITQSTFKSDASENILSIYPYDESERSDSNLLEIERKNSVNNGPQRPIPFNNLANTGYQNSLNTHLSTEGSKYQNSPSELNVQFEGGFVPLVLNPSKERESIVHLDYVQPPHLRRPHRPFLFNESIPFHGTFKPGVPDFSGFNISHYTQEVNLYEPNHLSDHIALLSAPKPQLMQRGISSMNGLPLELFRRPNDGITRSQVLNYGVQPQMLQLSPHSQQQLLFQLPQKHQQNFLIPATETEDLDEGSSQRIQVSLQASNEKKILKDAITGIQIRQPSDRNRHPGFIPPKLIAPSPPIQRRPDVVDEDDVNYSSQQRPPHPKFHPSYIPNREQPDRNTKIHPIHLRFPGIRRPQPFKRPPPNANNSFKDRRRPIPQRIPHTRPNLMIKSPNMLVPPAHITRPHQEISQDNPFIYRLPDRQLLHQLKPALKVPSNVPNTRHPPNYQIPFNGHPNILSEDNTAYKIPLPQPTGNRNQEILISQNNEQPLQAYSKIPSNMFTNPDINSDIYVASPEQTYTKQTVKQHVRLPTVTTSSTEANVTPKPLTIEKENKDQKYTENLTGPQLFLADAYNNYDKNPTVLEENVPFKISENGKIISVEKSETQEIHLPPVILQNIPHDSGYLNLGQDMHNFETKLETKPSEINSMKTQKPTQKPITLKTETDIEGALATDATLKFLQEHFPEKPDQASVEEKVPFGARLNVKLSPNDNVHVKPIFQQPPRPTVISSRRQPQFSSPPAKEAHNIQITTNKPAKPLQQNSSNLYFNPAMNKNKSVVNRYIQVEKKIPTHKPIEREKISLATYPGRKNILPSDNSQNHSPPRSPPKAPENIQLPHISETPPSNDNGTDYSILSHILSLIGGQPQPMQQEASASKDSHAH